MSASSPAYAIVIPAYNEAEELPLTLAVVRRAMAALGDGAAAGAAMRDLMMTLRGRLRLA